MDVAIRLKGVYKTFNVRDKKNDTLRDRLLNGFSVSSKREIIALSDINLEIQRGEFIGVIGGNGSGKSTLLQIISGAYVPNSGGEVAVIGKTLRLSLGMGFNNELTARENIRINASLLGLTFREIREVMDEMIDFAGIKSFENTKLKFYSKGMRMRLAFSIALYSKAEVLLLDEIFGGVGDVAFRRKANNAFKTGLLKDKTVILATHSTSVLERFADRVLLLEGGSIVSQGEPRKVIEDYLAGLGEE
ncbi:MAG: ATP-binding cassette domain-containing protein [Flavobacteriales bacterium]